MAHYYWIIQDMEPGSSIQTGYWTDILEDRDNIIIIHGPRRVTVHRVFFHCCTLANGGIRKGIVRYLKCLVCMLVDNLLVLFLPRLLMCLHFLSYICPLLERQSLNAILNFYNGLLAHMYIDVDIFVSSTTWTEI